MAGQRLFTAHDKAAALLFAMPGTGEGYHIEESSPGKRWNAYAPDVVMNPQGWSYTPSVGHLLVSEYDGQPSIQNVYVHPEHQRKGVGRALWERAGRPKHVPGAQTDEGKVWADAIGGDDLWWAGNEHLREAHLLFAMPRADAYDLDHPQRRSPDQTPVRPGPWYHSTDAELDPGTVLDPARPNQFGYGGALAPRDDLVFMHRQPGLTQGYGAHTYEVEPLDEGPYPYNEDTAAHGAGFVSPRARVVRKMNYEDPDADKQRSFADAMARMGVVLFGAAARDDNPEMDWSTTPTAVPAGARWYHVSPNQLEPGSDLVPGGGRSEWDQDYSMFGAKGRRDHVWLEHDPYKLHRWIRPDGKKTVAPYVYEVEPTAVPQPWNNTGAYGWVTPSAKVKRLINGEGRVMRNEFFPEEFSANPRQAAVLLGMPMRDAWDDEIKDQDSLQHLSPERRDIAVYDIPQRGWIHTSPRPHAPGDVLTPRRDVGTSEYQEYYNQTGHGSRRNWVWMSPRPEFDDHYRWATPDDYVYEVEPTTEGPFPWNGTGSDGYVAPEVKVKSILRQPEGPADPTPSWTWNSKPVLPSWEQPGATPDPLSTVIDGDPWKAASLAPDERSMVLGMLTIPQLTAATYYHITDRPDFTLDPTHRPQNNTTLGGDMEPGVFMTQHAEPWLNGYGYWRPYVAEIEAPDDLSTRPGVVSQGYSGEVYAPASTYPEMKVNRVIPVDAYGREQYGTSGWIEDANGRDFQTGEPLAPQVGNIPTHPGYRYPGTAMDQSPEWRKQYQKQVRKYQRGHPSIM